MRKILSLIIAAAILLSMSAIVFANEESITLAELLEADKETVTAIRLTLPDDGSERVITDKDKIGEFFKLCESTKLVKQTETPDAAKDFSGMYIMLETADGKFGGFAYVMSDGYADKYALMMSRLPAKAFAFEKAESVQKTMDEILSLADTNDIICSDWARNYVMKAEKTGISSYTDYTLPATRLEFCEMIYNTLRLSLNLPDKGMQPASVFKDCDSFAVLYLYNLGVVSGTDEKTFSPEEKINREQVAAIVYRLAKHLKVKGFLESYLLSSYMYIDGDQMSDWAIEAISQLNTAGIMDGVGGDCFAPKENFTLEQSTVLSMRLFAKLAEEKVMTAPDEQPDSIIGGADGPTSIFVTAEPSTDLRTFFEKESILLTCEMDALTESKEYVSIMASSEEINSELGKMADGDYKEPSDIHIFSFDTEAAKQLINFYSGEIVSDELYEKLKNRINGSFIGNMINARYGTSTLAATTMINAAKGYIMPNDFENNTVVILEYDGEYSSIVSFSKIGDKVISANATFVKNTDKNIMDLFGEIINTKRNGFIR